uniref:Uncharacterized protein n=1 Tax=Anguilla anguilla TaxID=7936 RepID=A0A0E9T5F3_ANGAN
MLIMRRKQKSSHIEYWQCEKWGKRKEVRNLKLKKEEKKCV